MLCQNHYTFFLQASIERLAQEGKQKIRWINLEKLVWYFKIYDLEIQVWYFTVYHDISSYFGISKKVIIKYETLNQVKQGYLILNMHIPIW